MAILLPLTVRAPRHRAMLATVLAALLIANELCFWARQLASGAWTFPRNLPLQLCDVVVFLMAWALCRPAGRRVGEVAYLWGVAATSQALLTPDLPALAPAYYYAKFFLTHALVVIAAVYLAAALGWRPGRGALWRVWGITNLYAAVMGAANALLGTNYLYLCAKPARASLLDGLGPWPWYIIGMELLALLFFGLALAPFGAVAARRRAAGAAA